MGSGAERVRLIVLLARWSPAAVAAPAALVVLVTLLALAAPAAHAQEPGSQPPPAASAAAATPDPAAAASAARAANGEASSPPVPPARLRPPSTWRPQILDLVPRWVAVPRTSGRLGAADVGLVINTADPYSVAVGAYYAERRGLRADQVLRVELPLRAQLEPAEFETLQQRIDEAFGDRVQALALAWVQPYAVACNSITGALALGLDLALCRSSCDASRLSPYANSASSRPYTDLGLRLSMLLAAPDVDAAKRLIDRGVRADRSLVLGAAPVANVFLLLTDDPPRNVRALRYPPPGRIRLATVAIRVQDAKPVRPLEDVLLLQTGSARVPQLAEVQWLDGGLGDHLTSFGGRLAGDAGQTTALDWIASGATASYGTVSEPCNHLQKFPHPQWLLLHYLQGVTAIEAYWKSVQWPQQGLFVGEPLAAPFARR